MSEQTAHFGNVIIKPCVRLCVCLCVHGRGDADADIRRTHTHTMREETHKRVPRLCLSDINRRRRPSKTNYHVRFLFFSFHEKSVRSGAGGGEGARVTGDNFISRDLFSHTTGEILPASYSNPYQIHQRASFNL